jgi:hypothetical protein
VVKTSVSKCRQLLVLSAFKDIFSAEHALCAEYLDDLSVRNDYEGSGRSATIT